MNFKSVKKEIPNSFNIEQLFLITGTYLIFIHFYTEE